MALTDLPDDLPAPEDDGGADHLVGMELPPISLAATGGSTIDPSAIEGWLVLYVYPMTGRPDRELPPGWEQIPGARGCTPQSCAFRDHHDAIRARGATVLGLSVQDTGYQQEMVDRLHLPYPVLSDAEHRFAEALRLPTMTVVMSDDPDDRAILLKRLTMLVANGRIAHVMYPVFPPDRNADDVEAWLTEHT